MSEVPDTWTVATFDDVAEYISRGKSPKYADRSDLPVVNQRAIRWFGIQDEHLKYIHPDQIPIWTAERFIRPGDILWNSTGTGTIGRACLVKPENVLPPKVVDSHVTIVRSAAQIVDPRFLFAWIRGPEVQQSIGSLSSGSTNQIELNRSTIATTTLPLAPIREQHRIADKLDTLLGMVDACHERLDRVPQILKRLREAVLEAAVSGRLTEAWRVGVTGSSRLDSWTTSIVSDIADVGTGSTPLRSRADFYAESGTPWITSAATARPYVTEALEYVTPAAIAEHRLRTYPIGTLLVAMYGEGRTRGQVSELALRATINQACAAIVVNEAKVRRGYLKVVLWSAYEEMRRLAEGGNQPNLNLSKVKTFPVPVPPLTEQVEIVRRVDELFMLAATLERRYSEAVVRVEKLLPSILTKAFRGELVPQDPSDEPASALLEKSRMSRDVSETDDRSSQGRKENMKKDAKKRESRKLSGDSKSATETSDLKGAAQRLLIALKGAGQVSPEKLLTLSGLGIDDFYSALRDAEADGRVKEIRRGSFGNEVLLEAKK